MLLGLAHPPRSSERCEAKLDTSLDGMLVLYVGEQRISARLERVEVSVGVGSTPSKITFPDGWLFVAQPCDELTTFLKQHNQYGWVGKLEKNALVLVICSVVILSLTVGTFTHGIPWITERVVAYLPEPVSKMVEERVLVSLDKQLFEPSELDLSRQGKIRQRFEGHLRELGIDGKVRLLFRSSDLGVNAFALSHNTIIVLDDLVKLMETQQQLDGILFHELGHLEHQHVMKSIVRSSLLSISVALLTGESSGVIDNLAGIGVFVANNGQSQQAEREADRYAEDSMWLIHGTNKPMSEMFELLQGSSDHLTELPAWLRTHPELTERIDLLKRVQ
ncbi:M48 family metallopeptidase [Vibrio sp. MED222]|uniref:M48 family metallopeptidase n=1 Tax=Vibrio sp. MED222 TaxID=314290 RepID=UPI000068A7A0|nr:M48 family metallopeptidase [Vibrio sp. MED222]EAQ52742.1 Zn-dependent protease with chaperone function [Vibrio sp. MED222]